MQKSGWSWLLKLLVCFILLGNSFPEANGSGVRTRLTLNGLDYASQVAVDLLMKHLSTAKIPDVYDTVGSIQMFVSNITMKDFRRPTLNMTIIQNLQNSFGGLKVVFSELDPTIDCTMQLSYNWGLFTTNRELLVNIVTSSLTVTLEAIIGTDLLGNTKLADFKCNIIGNVQMTFQADSGLGSLFSFLTETLNDKIKEIMFDQVCTNLTNLINSSLLMEMSAANMSSIVLDDDLYLDLKFTASPNFTNSWIETSHSGKLGLRMNSTSSNLPIRIPTIPPLPQHSSRMVYAFITDYVVNSAWHAALTGNKLHLNVTLNMPRFPRLMRRYLASSCAIEALCLGTIYPQLSTLYRRHYLEMELSANHLPGSTFRFQGRSVEFRSKGSVKFYMKSRRSRDFIFSIMLLVNGNLQFSTVGDRILFNPLRFNVNVNSIQSNLTAVSRMDNLIHSLVRTASQRALLPYLRELGAEGYQIPSLPWLRVNNTLIIDSGAQGVMVLGTDIVVDAEAFQTFENTTQVPTDISRAQVPTNI